MVYNVLLSAEDISAEKPGPNKETTETEDVISLISFFFFCVLLVQNYVIFLKGNKNKLHHKQEQKLFDSPEKTPKISFLLSKIRNMFSPLKVSMGLNGKMMQENLH